MNPTPAPMRVAIRCSVCGRIVAYKLGETSGKLQVKCPKCGTEIKLDLSLRRAKHHISYRKSSPSILNSNNY